VGVDLAATSDLTAVSYMIVKDGIYYFKTDYYVPESALLEKADRELYKYWRRQGLLKVTKGNVTDYDYITNDMMSYSNIVSIQKVGYDKYNSTQWAITATDLGLPLEEYPQSLGNFNKPTRELERLILSGKAKIDNNEITRWCFKNVTLKSDHNGNVKPNKSIRAKKIDGVIAMIQALGMYLDSPHFSNQIITI
jgi:phage terminase large subunit-like protein